MPVPLMFRVTVALLFALVLGGCASHAPAPQLWDLWTAHNEQDRKPLDNREWAAFLQRYAKTGSDGVTRVAYGAVTHEDMERLGAWLRLMQQMDVSELNLREQRAYWLNLYNAEVVRLVLVHYPLDSVDALQPPWWKRWWPGVQGPFAEPLLEVDGQALSLDDIENHILRPRWLDPRTVYLLCKARLGSPPLAPQPYAAEYLDEQIEAQARRWVNGPYALRIDAHGRLRVAELYRRYRSDFGDEAAVLAQLRRYAAPPLAAQLAKVDGIHGYIDDRRLNDAAD